MGLLDSILGIFGTKLSYGNVDPSSLESVIRADHEIDQAERDGPPALAAALAKWGFKSKDAWDAAHGDASQKLYATMPNYASENTRIRTLIQMESLHAAGVPVGLHPSMATMADLVEGVSLAQYAKVQARLERVLGTGVEPTVLAAFQLDPTRWRAVDAGWRAKMTGLPGAAVLSQFTVLLSAERADANRVA